MIICAGNNETFKFAKAMGVGLVVSAINMTRQCLFDKPEYI
ncbi:MAG: purine-nucleoside phosphorylase, partial [Campylobacteraceae bacterium]|nr:purine-nucleoside phosphorylase [Campylobacteraceae bacterium]